MKGQVECVVQSTAFQNQCGRMPLAFHSRESEGLPVALLRASPPGMWRLGALRDFQSYSCQRNRNSLKELKMSLRNHMQGW